MRFYNKILKSKTKCQNTKTSISEKCEKMHKVLPKRPKSVAKPPQTSLCSLQAIKSQISQVKFYYCLFLFWILCLDLTNNPQITLLYRYIRIYVHGMGPCGSWKAVEVFFFKASTFLPDMGYNSLPPGKTWECISLNTLHAKQIYHT